MLLLHHLCHRYHHRRRRHEHLNVSPPSVGFCAFVWFEVNLRWK